jgi:hypothetical protein
MRLAGHLDIDVTVSGMIILTAGECARPLDTGDVT